MDRRLRERFQQPRRTNTHLYQQESDAGDMHATATAVQTTFGKPVASVVEDLAQIAPRRDGSKGVQGLELRLW